MASFGNVMLWGGLIAIVISLVAYTANAWGVKAARTPARLAFFVSGACMLAASAVLLAAFLQGHYEIAYVSENSSSDLPTMYRVSAFWAGQAGSFLLWALLGALIGIALIVRGRRWEGPVMAVFSATQLFLMFLLVVKSPFELMEHNPGDGFGLNPLLQDPWMAIHPPLIFLGYAALAVPFAFAIAALARREYDRWVTAALPWTIFGWATMGAGIFVGGYWAYRVLGWGGYWGWDPVENASLIPWLLSTALLHGMILQRTRGSMRRSNLLLAIGSFVTVLYGTFLTRSGVLSAFSQHSFPAELSSLLYGTLLWGMLLSFVAPVILFFRRVREVKSNPTYDELLSRDFAFFAGVLVLCISAAIVTLGTSWPIITSGLTSLHLYKSPVSLEPGWYNRMHFPVAVLLGLLVGVAPIVSWGANNAAELGRGLRVHLAVAVAGAILALAVGAAHVQHGVWMVLLIATSVFCLSASTGMLIAKLRTSPLTSGGPLSHVGLALMLIGIVGSGVYSRAQEVALQKGETAEDLGYQVTFNGIERPNDQTRVMKLTLQKGKTRFDAAPRIVMPRGMDGETNPEKRFQMPHVQHFWLQDIYVSPKDIREAGPAAGANPHAGAVSGGPILDLGKGESGKAGGYTVTFDSFDTTHDMSTGAGAVVKVLTPDGRTETVRPFVKVDPANGSLVPDKPVQVPGTKVSVSLVDMKVPRITLAISGLPGAKSAATPPPAAKPETTPEGVIVEVSNKPLINLLWLGTVLVLAGGCVGMARRARESRKADIAEAKAEAATPPAASGGKRRERRERRERAHEAARRR